LETARLVPSARLLANENIYSSVKVLFAGENSPLLPPPFRRDLDSSHTESCARSLRPISDPVPLQAQEV